MQTPEKYKSIPASSLYNRNIVVLNEDKKAKIQNIIVKFIQYLKVKHS